jgi:ATP-dependent RNA helicase DDX54/DBP10
MRKLSQKTKWDRKKKKFVSLQSTLEKSKKIKTESGRYINASYKSDLYSKWLKNGRGKRVLDEDNNEQEDEDRSQKKNKKFFGSSSIGKIDRLSFFKKFKCN